MSDCPPVMSVAHKKPMWPVLIAVWATFLLYSALAAPVPGANEPHYLCKSLHYWQPDWCAPDFFLTSPNAHTVFYATIGALTQVLSLDQAAWAGRGIVYFLLALGWTRSLSQIFCSQWSCLWVACVYLTLASIGNFSGEWLVGGVEGKVPCYGFLLLAFAETLQQRPRRAALWAGLAISFHPVVGVWGVLAHALSRIVSIVMDSRRYRRSFTSSLLYQRQDAAAAEMGNPQASAGTGHSARQAWIAVAIFTVVSLPGLIPVFRLLTETVPAQTRYAGTYLQVYFRLAHHLDPMMFSAQSYVGYAILLILWGCSLAWGGRTLAKIRLDGIVLWAVVFAFVGILIGWGPRPAKLMPYFAERMNLLKFYPFRLADVLLPVAFSISLVSVLERTLLVAPRSPGLACLIWKPQWLLLVCFLGAALLAHSRTDQNRYSRENRHDWLDACGWIDTHLRQEALVLSPSNGWAFKWFARRAEYVSFKDCPQDAAGIVEWNRRLNFLQKWFEENYADGLYSNTELKDLRARTGATHLLTDRLGPMELTPAYKNETFQVYDLESLD